jgi:hypothetical protein
MIQYNHSSNYMQFTTNDNERMRIDSSGNVNIGSAASVTGLRFFDIYNTGSTSTDGSIIRFITQQVGNTSTTSADIYKRKNGEFTFANNDADSAAYTRFTLAGSEAMRIDSSGNVGVGVTPSGWTTNISTRALQVGSVTALWEVAGVYSSLSSNHYYAQDSTQRYITSNPATRYYQYNGEHVFMGAVSGTAGNIVPFSEHMRINSVGRLLVGTDTNNVYYNSTTQYAGDVVIDMNITSNVTDLVLINSNNSFGSTVDFATNNSAGNPVRHGLIGAVPESTTAGSESGRLIFSTKNTTDNNIVERMRIDSSGHAIIPAGVTLGTSVGVYNAANTLDDYEEGTWTPSFDNGYSGITYNIQKGIYTKVGRVVTAYFRVVMTSATALNSVVRITGLPFTAISDGSIYWTGQQYMNSGGSGGQNLKMLVFPQTNSIYAYQQNTASVTQLFGTTLGTTFDILGSVTYMAN